LQLVHLQTEQCEDQIVQTVDAVQAGAAVQPRMP
jgi:hypothetical protein